MVVSVLHSLALSGCRHGVHMPSEGTQRHGQLKALAMLALAFNHGTLESGFRKSRTSRFQGQLQGQHCQVLNTPLINGAPHHNIRENQGCKGVGLMPKSSQIKTSDCIQPIGPKVLTDMVPGVPPIVTPSRSVWSRSGRCRYPILCASEGPEKDTAPATRQDGVKKAFTLPPLGWPPKDFLLFLGDLAVLLPGAGIYTVDFDIPFRSELGKSFSYYDPSLWLQLASSPELVLNWLLLSLPWVISGSITNAWDEAAGIPGKAFRLGLRAAVPYILILAAVQAAMSGDRDLDEVSLYGRVQAGLAFLALWRAVASAPAYYY